MQVGAFEAKNTLGALLDRVEQGEEIVITRHGKPVARLAPCATTVDGQAARDALARIRARARAQGVTPVAWEVFEGGPRRWTTVSLVLDGSATLAWVYGEETTQAVRAVFETVASSGAWVPALWRLEVANVLEMGVRRSRHDAAFRDATLADLALLPIRLDLETDQHAWSATARLAAAHRLTLYDAAYLELARRRDLPLATLDQELRAAALAEGVPLLGMDA